MVVPGGQATRFGEGKMVVPGPWSAIGQATRFGEGKMDKQPGNPRVKWWFQGPSAVDYRQQTADLHQIADIRHVDCRHQTVDRT